MALEFERTDRMTRWSHRPAIAAAITLVWLTAACASHSTARRPPAADTGAAARKQVNTSSLRPAPTRTDHASGSGLKRTCQVLAANLDFLEQATSGSDPDLQGAIVRMRSLERSAPVEIQPDVKVIADFDQHVLDAVSTGGSAADIRETPQLSAALLHEAAWVSNHCR